MLPFGLYQAEIPLRATPAEYGAGKLNEEGYQAMKTLESAEGAISLRLGYTAWGLDGLMARGAAREQLCEFWAVFVLYLSIVNTFPSDLLLHAPRPQPTTPIIFGTHCNFFGFVFLSYSLLRHVQSDQRDTRWEPYPPKVVHNSHAPARTATA